ncbi:NAD(P)H-hydrate dehydratase [Gallaecimonas mangrovi]|uniref:NAD(P)H-hydrate dehydratase n=1 Tax=Gallaecimonas mangrovi TaxID=2291597 RepID=UPI000E205F73|nr:NAD(P)H-hydrate dehydratase [Gallaecimonas mangrovi]
MLTPLLKALPSPLPTAAELKVLEKSLAEAAGLSLYQLMERAGLAAYSLLRQRWPDAKHLLVLAGSGNNGGDAYVLARHAVEDGLQVTLVASGDPKAAEARQACEAFYQKGGQLLAQLPQPCLADVVVDGLLGMGLNSEVRGKVQPLQQFLAQTALPILSIDVPSGLASDTGHWWGPAFMAAAVVTFIFPKAGLLTGQGRASWQQAWLATLELSPNATVAITACDFDTLTALRPTRKLTAHKGDSGRLLLVGGNLGMSGAIRLAGHAALRTGAGLVKVFTHPGSALAVMLEAAELMVVGAEQWPDDAFSPRAVAVGPGLGQNPWAQSFFDKALSYPVPKVIDADALNLLAAHPRPVPNSVLTPHPGEAARLLGTTIQDIEADRPGAVRALAARYQSVVLLKGAGTLVCDGNNIWLLAVGSPAMAVGGMGDVLSGIIGALLAQGLSPVNAALLGAALHGEAGRRAGESGVIGTLASDLFVWVRKLINA